MRSFYQKFRNFYYLLSRAQSKVLTLISYILYFTVYFLLFVNCSLLPTFFVVCVCAKKCGVVCIFYFFSCFFATIVYIAQNPIRIFLYFLYIFKSRRYARHRMQPVTIDVAWSLCVCLLDTTMSYAKTDELWRCYMGCEIGLAQGTMPYPSRRVQRGLCLLHIYNRELCKNG